MATRGWAKWSKMGGMHTPARTRTLLMMALVALLVFQAVTYLPTSDQIASATPSTSRIVVVSNETSIPLALGTPSTGLKPFNNVLTNKMGIHLTGQVVDGNYTPIWQPGAVNNHGIPDAVVHWAFGNEPDRAHSNTADQNGYFSIFLTPDTTAPTTTTLRLWFDGRSDTVYGIPIFPAAKIIYDISISETMVLTVTPVQSRVMVGDTILVQGALKGPGGAPVPGEGLMPLFDGKPAMVNPRSGWFVDNIAIGQVMTGFEDGLDGFEPGGKGSWSAGAPSIGPEGCYQSLNCAGASLAGHYAYDTDSWLTSPAIDMTTEESLTLSFDSWADLSPGDEIVLELSNDNGVTWPVTLDVLSATGWTPMSFEVSTFYNTPFGDVTFSHKPDVRFRLRLIGHTLPVTTDTDGKFEFSFTVPLDRAAGSATVRVEHPATTQFAATATNAEVHIARWTKVVATLPESAYRGTPVDIRAQVLDTDGSPIEQSVPGHSVAKPMARFWLRQGDKEAYIGERSIDVNGYSSIGFQPTRDHPLGSATVRCSFSGNEFYSPAEVTHDLTIKAHTETEITSPKVASMIAQDTLVVEGAVHLVRAEASNDVIPDPVVKKDVVVLLEGVEVGKATTDTDGRFRFEYDVRGLGIDLGIAIIQVLFPGDIVYEASEGTVDFSILSNTSIQSQPKVVQKGSIAVIDGTLTSVQGGLGGIIEVSIDGGLYRKVVTGANGRFATTYDVPWTMDTGPVSVTLTYRGTRTYRPSSLTLTYIVESGSTIQVSQDPLVGHRGAGITMKGTLLDARESVTGLPIAGAQVDLELPDGTFASATTNPNGNFTYYYVLPNTLGVGDTEAIVTYSGENHGTSKATIPIRVTSATSLVFTEVGPAPITETTQSLIKVLLYDDAGAPVTGRSITVVSVRPGIETILFVGPTDSAGALAFRTAINGSGPHTLVARFSGDANYEQSEASHYITVGPAPTPSIPLVQQPTVILGGGLSLVLILSIVMTESGKYFLFKLILVPMYSKLKKEDVLDHFVRGQIYGMIRMTPGAHYNQIKQKLDLSNGVLSYHLSTLEREGYILSEMDGIYKRFFPNHVKFEVDYPIFLTNIQERIVDFIKSKPGLTQKEVAKELGISTSTVNDNVLVLKQANILELRRDGKRTRCYLVEV